MIQFKIEPMLDSDWNSVSQIYQEGIATGNATFETEIPSWQEWNDSHLQKPRLVARSDSRIVGWAAVSPVSERCVYGGVGEVSVYVSASEAGKGLGTKLLNQLIVDSESAGIWTLQAGIFPENKSSIVIHEKCGFRTLGVRQRLGKMNGVWRDVVLMERRSALVGVE
jgi:L-amino acid N-acyltransferase YncA